MYLCHKRAPGCCRWAVAPFWDLNLRLFALLLECIYDAHEFEAHSHIRARNWHSAAARYDRHAIQIEWPCTRHTLIVVERIGNIRRSRDRWVGFV
jgi:hypothetical protein